MVVGDHRKEQGPGPGGIHAEVTEDADEAFEAAIASKNLSDLRGRCS